MKLSFEEHKIKFMWHNASGIQLLRQHYVFVCSFTEAVKEHENPTQWSPLGSFPRA